jgi:PBP4 family serine-type D-alanyl-D-alanine carboxypeptidase
MSFRWSTFLVVAIAAAAAGSIVVARSSAAATAVPSDIRAIFDKPLYKSSIWGLRVQEGTKVLLDLRPEHHFYIGSVRKVFSVGQLFDAVGAGRTYDTPVYRTGTIDGGGVLHGNLILVASGDLTMGGRTNPDGTIAVSDWDHNEADSLGNAVLTKPDPLAGYARLSRAVKAAGIRRVAGEIVIDDRLFQPWTFRNEFDVRPIFVNDDMVDISITPGGQPGSRANLTSRPKSAALLIDNRLVIGPPKSENTLAIDPFLPQCIGSKDCSSTVKGSLPSDFVPPLTGEPVLVRAVRIVQPSNYARTVFVEALTAAGVTVDAPAVEQNPLRLLPAKGSYRAGNRVAQLKGLPYGQDAKLVLKISYNIGADTSLVLFGLTRNADSMSGALRVERQNLATHFGIPSAQYHFVDGSGGGETWAINGAVTRMLDELAKRPQHQAFFDALPILGVDGSIGFVKDFQNDPTLSGATGRVHAKTGTYGVGTSSGMLLKGQALGGYITTKSGKHLTFQLVVNDVPLTGVEDIIKVFQDQGTIAAMLWRDF